MSSKIDLRRLVTLAVAALAVSCLAAAPAARAQDDSQNEDETPRPEAKEKEKEKEKAEAGEPDETVLAIVGGDIMTVTRGTIRRGTILVRDGVIAEVGQDVEVPEDAEVIDATGKVVTPGFVATEMSGVGVGYSSNSQQNEVADSLDPFDRNIKFCLGSGITAGAVQVGGPSRMRFFFEPGPGPGVSGPVELTIDDLLALHAEGQLDDETLDHLLRHAGGHADGHDHGDALFGASEPGLVPLTDDRFFGPEVRVGTCPECADAVIDILPEPLALPSPTRPRPSDYVVLRLTFGELDGMLAAEDPFYALPASALTGPFNVYSWRENIKKAREYIEAREQYEADKEAGKKDVKEPRKEVDDNLIKLVEGEIPLRTEAGSADQIRDMIALAKELDYDLVLDQVYEGWVVAEELGEARVPVIITPRQRLRPDPGREDSTGTSIEMPGILEEAGVPFAIAPLGAYVSMGGLAGRDLMSLPLEAAFAVRGGASESAALAALTIVPARILGMDDRIGSIEEGKDADLLILDGPPLDYRTYVDRAIVAGKVRYDRDEDRVFPVFDRDAR